MEKAIMQTVMGQRSKDSPSLAKNVNNKPVTKKTKTKIGNTILPDKIILNINEAANIQSDQDAIRLLVEKLIFIYLIYRKYDTLPSVQTDIYILSSCKAIQTRLFLKKF